MTNQKQRNAFRWVALRDQLRVMICGFLSLGMTTNGGPMIRDRPDLLKLIAVLIKEEDEPVSARERAAREYIDSHDYVFRNRLWKPFLPLRPALAVVLRSARPNSESSLLAEIEAILAPTIGQQSLTDFINGPNFPILHNSLWHSYYATLILPRARPQDQPILVFWIRVFQILEMLAKGEPLGPFLESFEKIRPAVPLAIVGRKPQREAETPKSLETDEEEASARALTEARENIARLREVRTRLGAMVAERLAELNSSSIAIDDTRDTRNLIDPLKIQAADLNEVDKAFLSQMGRSCAGTLSCDHNRNRRCSVCRFGDNR